MNPLLWFTPFGSMLFFMGLLLSGSESKKTTDMQGRLMKHWQLLMMEDAPEHFKTSLKGLMM